MNLNLFKEVVLTPEEAEFLQDTEQVRSQSASGLNQTRIMMEMYFIKHLERNTYDIINSNKELAKSNEKYANRMVWLTIALVFAAFAQIIVAVIK